MGLVMGLVMGKSLAQGSQETLQGPPRIFIGHRHSAAGHPSGEIATGQRFQTVDKQGQPPQIGLGNEMKPFRVQSRQVAATEHAVKMLATGFEFGLEGVEYRFDLGRIGSGNDDEDVVIRTELVQVRQPPLVVFAVAIQQVEPAGAKPEPPGGINHGGDRR